MHGSFYPPDTNLCRNTCMKMRGRNNKYFVCLYIFVNMPTNVCVPTELSISRDNEHSQIHIKNVGKLGLVLVYRGLSSYSVIFQLYSDGT